ncbi:MAG: hypothetical protein DVB23_000291 [Verrucomicrobia bacterium]|jgi:uncharacterized protein (DUF2237 family)|nr:MAG: hypothetical protein DVB23_000291 [Verrucomicrobiota bacterium]
MRNCLRSEEILDAWPEFIEEGLEMDRDLNVLGGPLEPCSLDPVTGFYRNGRCSVGEEDVGCHAVCVRVSAEFLAFSQAVGNDLSTPMPAYGFPGLQPGDRWCLCAPRWKEALDAGYAPPVYLKATHRAALDYVTRSILEEYAIDSPIES